MTLTTVLETVKNRVKFLTNITDFEKLTAQMYLTDSIFNEYMNHYSALNHSSRNILNTSPCEMLIISPSGLVNEWESYAAFKDSLNLSTNVVDIADITATYSGRDSAEKLRNFLIEAYTEWSSNPTPLKYVLLGGDAGFVPERALRIDAYYNSGWHHNNVYSDHYYSGLDGNWDSDNDSIFGEGDATIDTQASGNSGDEADLLFEVAVGRIPVETTTEFNNWFLKQRDYTSQTVAEDFYQKALMIGERLSSTIFGGPAMDELAGYFPEYSISTLYAIDATYSEAAIVNHINSGTALVNHLGHGNPTTIFSFTLSDIENNLTNTDYPFIYTQGCNTSKFTTDDAIAECFILDEHGAFALVGNTSYGFYSSFENQGTSQLYHREFYDAFIYGFYSSFENQGTSQLYHREFYDAFIREEFDEIGLAFNDGKEDLIGMTAQTGTKRYVYYDNILFADPSTLFISEIQDVSVVQTTPNIIELNFSGVTDSSIFTLSNYSVYERDDTATTYAVTSITQNGNSYNLNLASNLPAGIPLEIKMENITNHISPSIKKVTPLYTIKESSIVSPVTWTIEESPIYIYKHQIVNSILTIEPGVEVRINQDKGFYIYWGGKIITNGDSTAYVNFTSYSDNPNATDNWVDLTFLMDPADDSQFNYTTIKNSKSGIWLDSLSTIELNHVKLSDNLNYGLYSYYSTVNANYLEVTNTQAAASKGIYFEGGEANISHLSCSNNSNLELVAIDNVDLTIENSIVWGDYTITTTNKDITYSILSNSMEGEGNQTNNPLFVSAEDFSLTSASPAINAGNTSSPVDTDGTITDIGFHSFYSPANFTGSIVLGSSPKVIQLSNGTLGEVDSLFWDFDNNETWDSQEDNAQFTIDTEGTQTVKMRLVKGAWSKVTTYTNFITSTFTAIDTNINNIINVSDPSTYSLNWDSINNSDYYLIYSSELPGSDFSLINTQSTNSYEGQLDDSSMHFYYVVPVEQEIIFTY
ncbi:MAG: hypothetical protein B6226_02470 [Candidatus Cloacimonetes bacterium 4572_65]|nr:MAG: hypothetical protein B6226_02470 [Candidatus Cloacimonetes bacterium 4572_65]